MSKTPESPYGRPGRSTTIGSSDTVDSGDADDDTDEDEFEPVEIHSELRPPSTRRMSKSDASSIVGGEPVEEYGKRKRKNDPLNKVFSFSLPFGGLSSVRSNIAKQLQSFRLDAILNSGNEQLKKDMELMLERQVSIGTMEDASYFKHVKKTDNSRIRAVKKSLTNNLNEFLPKKEPKSYQSVFNEIEGNIVVMGGYRGSILRDAKTHKRLWIPIKAGFNLRKINLLLGPNYEDELRATDLIYPDGVLANIGPIDICRKLIKKLAHNPKTNVKEFGYDWRLGTDLTSTHLQTFLEEIYESTGKPTLVIAHSMGGLVAHSALQAQPHLFRSLIYVGVPSECLNILGPLRYTDSVIFSDRILTHEVNFMMRSSFSFLPLSGKVFMDSETHEFYELDLFDPDTWVEYGLSPLVSKKRALHEANFRSGPRIGRSSRSASPPLHDDSPFPSLARLKHYKSLIRRVQKRTQEIDSPSTPRSPTLSDDSLGSPESTGSFDSLEDDHEHYAISFTEAYNYLSETLKRAKKFILSLDYREELEAQYPPMAIVYGNTVPSVRGSLVSGPQDIKDGNYFGFFYGHGDGVVHQKWLMPERKGFRPYDEETGHGQIVGKFASDTGHVSLMTDFKAMGSALSAVWEAEKNWKR